LTIIGASAIGGAAFFLARAEGFSARAEPSAPERVLARTARRLATPRSARGARNPVAFTPDAWTDARAHFADHCASCHGNDGRGNTVIGRNIYPRAPDMGLPATQGLTDGELYWIIENGVRLSGMPAFGDGTADDTDTWKLVHFVRHLNDLTPEHLKEMEGLNPKSPSDLEEERQDQAFLEGTEQNQQEENQQLKTHVHREQP
jgi:mono/diheme cytochrome c family protein